MTAPPITHNSKKLVQRLQEKIRRVEVSSRNDDGTTISSGSAAIDQMLPATGYNRGTIIQWLAENGSGASFLSLMAAKNAASDGGAIVIIDPQQRFYPPAARALGINLSNLIVLQSQNISTDSNDLLWAIDQSLRCSAVAAVWGELPEFETPQIATRWQRRFQLSAETSGCCGMFTHKIKGKTESLRAQSSKRTNGITPLSSASHYSSSWAEVQWHVRPLPNTTECGDTRLLRATLMRCRGGVAGRSIDLEFNTITGNVQQARREHATTTYTLPLATQLANPKIGRRAARA